MGGASTGAHANGNVPREECQVYDIVPETCEDRHHRAVGYDRCHYVLVSQAGGHSGVGVSGSRNGRRVYLRIGTAVLRAPVSVIVGNGGRPFRPRQRGFMHLDTHAPYPTAVRAWLVIGNGSQRQRFLVEFV